MAAAKAPTIIDDIRPIRIMDHAEIDTPVISITTPNSADIPANEMNPTEVATDKL